MDLKGVQHSSFSQTLKEMEIVIITVTFEEEMVLSALELEN